MRTHLPRLLLAALLAGPALAQTGPAGAANAPTRLEAFTVTGTNL
ncbi:MAG: hypothetical protein RL479_1757, partial [Verrucomicrobiota bacterium]